MKAKVQHPSPVATMSISRLIPEETLNKLLALRQQIVHSNKELLKEAR